MNRILIAEDEAPIARFLENGLRAQGFTPTTVADGVSAYDYASSGSFDLLLLDVGLPLLDGFAVLRRLRADGNRIPVIVLTARASVQDKVSGFEGGADDYLGKPFHFDELVARIRARLRPERAAAATELSCGGLTLDLRSRKATVSGREVELTAREFALVELFMCNPGQVLSREQLLSHVWGYDFDPGSNIVDVYIRHLRRKLGAERFTTLRRMGYRLEDLP